MKNILQNIRKFLLFIDKFYKLLSICGNTCDTLSFSKLSNQSEIVISSVSEFLTLWKGSITPTLLQCFVFSSTKSAIVGMMEGLWRELRWEGITGVKTTLACPSWISTGFAKNPRSGSEAVCPVQSAEQVADYIMEGFLAEEYRVAQPSPAGVHFLK